MPVNKNKLSKISYYAVRKPITVIKSIVRAEVDLGIE
jgi:hypothetical protein